MTQIEQVHLLPTIGAEFAGFIFYPKSPRYALRHLTTEQIRKVNSINKVGVFVNNTVEEVLKTVDDCRLQMVQLHGDESPKFCEKIAEYVSVIKAFRLSDNDSVEWMIHPYMDACDMFLFDTMGVGYGGTGKKFDWEVLKGLNIHKPFFLSGGIEPTDTQKLIDFQNDPVAKNLFAIDINSKFEIAPGIKNIEAVKEFHLSLQESTR